MTQNSLQESTLQEKLRNLLAGIPAYKPGCRITKLKGDASYRSYYRIMAIDDQSASCILMQWDPAVTNKSEEAGKGPSAIHELPFLNVQRYLLSGGLNVPKILNNAVSDGMLLLEDLGDITMEKAIEKSDASLKNSHYEKAVDALVQLQTYGEKERDSSCMAFHKSFDHSLYMWEFEHFIEFCIEARRNLKVPNSDREEMKGYFNEISRFLELIPKGLTHRDFQSRNLMICNNSLYIIDFQDALMGPPQYDMVALLKDSYVNISEKETEHLVSYYLSKRAESGFSLDNDMFWKGFIFQTIQRKLKDAGRFVFIEKIKRNPDFLQYIPQSLEYVKRYLHRESDFSELNKLLGKYIPELV